MEEYHQIFGICTEFLVKCGEFSAEKVHRTVGKPIQLIYAGKLYCNRWKTLSMVATAIRQVNTIAQSTILQMNIYTADVLTRRQRRALDDGRNSIVHAAVAPQKLEEIYRKGDIAMHVESFDLQNRLLTKDSFSTKVIDCLASGCAVMAVCWEKHAAGQYLKAQDAALVANSQEEIVAIIERLAKSPELVLEYARKAYVCGKNNHQRTKIQQQLFSCFQQVIDEAKSSNQ